MLRGRSSGADPRSRLDLPVCIVQGSFASNLGNSALISSHDLTCNTPFKISRPYITYSPRFSISLAAALAVISEGAHTQNCSNQIAVQQKYRNDSDAQTFQNACRVPRHHTCSTSAPESQAAIHPSRWAKLPYSLSEISLAAENMVETAFLLLHSIENEQRAAQKGHVAYYLIPVSHPSPLLQMLRRQ